MDEFIGCIEDASAVAVYKEGAAAEYKRGSAEFMAIMSAWHETIAGARPMPAFGVCIDSLTRQEKQSGVWIEFVFDEEHSGDGMPFEKLLLKVEPEYRGFNLCRFFNGKYGGRCFYLDLSGGDMRTLSAAAANLPAQERKKQC